MTAFIPFIVVALIIVSIPLILYFGINKSGNKKMFWVPIISGQSFVVKKNGIAHRYYGDPAPDKWVHPLTGKILTASDEHPRPILGFWQKINKKLWGFVWIGIYPIYKVGTYKQAWAKLDDDGTSLLNYPRDPTQKTETTDHIRFRYPYARKLSVDLGGNRIDITFVINIESVHLGEALVVQSAYLTQVFGIATKRVRAYVAQFNPTDTEPIPGDATPENSTARIKKSGIEKFRVYKHEDPDKQSDGIRASEKIISFSDTLMPDNDTEISTYGVIIESVQFINFTLSDKLVAAAEKKFLAEQEAAAILDKGRAEAEVDLLKKQAEAKGIKEVGEARNAVLKESLSASHGDTRIEELRVLSESDLTTYVEGNSVVKPRINLH
ncbi:hypothetical protein COB55_01785 [Candidatus Wolfebacteria bacterium]|nr:MAG: hypothetical protein COB55_01785 [Candidatus Wolfebacteria bacterium]